MPNEGERNRDQWVQLNQGGFLHTRHQGLQVSEAAQEYASVQGSLPAQGYASEGFQQSHSDYSDEGSSSYHPQTTDDDDGDEDDAADDGNDNDDNEDNGNGNDDDYAPKEKARKSVSSQRKRRKGKNIAKPKEEQPKSRRANLRARITAETGEVSAADSPKGLVKWQGNIFIWWDSEDRRWLKAAYHDQYRDQFISEDSSLGRYVVTPACGKGANDITSACSAFNQLEWRLDDRDSWSNIVDAEGNKVMYSLERPSDQTYEEPERLWIHDGCVLLDGDNNPVRPWTGIPRCFSSKIEGGRIEALRRIVPMTLQDFRARMLREVPTSASVTSTTKPLSYPSTFGHRCCRFRTQYQCPAWIPRAASDVLKKQVTDLLPEAEAATTTEGLSKLTRFEIEKRKASTRSQFLYKGNGRNLSEEERRDRDEKNEEKLKRQAAGQAKSPPRRAVQKVPATPGPYAASKPSLPTPPLSAGTKRGREEDDGVGRSADVNREAETVPAPKRARVGPSPLDPRRSLHNHPPPPFSYPPPPPSFPHRQPPPRPPRTTTSSYSFLPGPSTQTPYANNNPQRLRPDFRTIQPQTPLQQLRIQAALFYPRAHYFALTGGHHPPHTSTGSYRDQYNQIVAALLVEEQKMGSSRPRVQRLADVGVWVGGFDQVPVPNLPEEVVRAILNPVPDVDDATRGGVSNNAVGSGDGSGDVAHREASSSASDASTAGGSNGEPVEEAGSQDAEAAAAAEQIVDGGGMEWNDSYFNEFLGEDDGFLGNVGM